MHDSPGPRLRPIVIRGARTHNLKSVDLTIAPRRLTVVTGVSGSGKSSLAFDTIYAEGQRRYVESLSAYARQFLERMERPDVDSVEGMPPAIAIRQKNSIRNPRSTVGTTTETHDYLRLLFARVGRTVCRQCGTRRRPRNRRGRRRAAGAAAGGRAPAGRLRAADRPRRPARPGGTRREPGLGSGAGAGRRRARARPARAAAPGRSGGRGHRRAAAQGLRAPARRRPGDRLRRGRSRRARRSHVARGDRRSHPRRCRGAAAPDRRDRGRLPRRRRPGVRHRARRGRGRRSAAARVQRAVRVPPLRHRLRGAAAAAVLVQQPVRRLPDLPRLRQRDGAGHGPGRAGSDQDPERRRHRAVEQAALSRPARGDEAGGQGRRLPARRAVERAHRSRARRRAARPRRLRRRPGLLPVARAEEVQGPHPRLPRAATAATRRAPSAAARGCAARPATCAWPAGRSIASAR